MGQRGPCHLNLQMTHPAHSSQALLVIRQLPSPWCNSRSPCPSKLPSEGQRLSPPVPWMKSPWWLQPWSMGIPLTAGLSATSARPVWMLP